MNLYYLKAYIGDDGNFSQEINENFLKNLYKNYIIKMAKNSKFLNEFIRTEGEDFNKYCYDNLNKVNYLYKDEMLSKNADFYKSFVQKEEGDSQSNFITVNVKTEEGETRYGYDSKGYLGRGDHSFKIPKDMDAIKFKEISNIILPSVKNEKIYATCDTKALDTHIKLAENSDKLNYKEKDVRNHLVEIKIDKKEFIHNYYSDKMNKFGNTFDEDSSKKIKLSASFSYDYEEPFSCTHPPVYSPVNGKVIEAKNGRIVIEQKEFSKLFDGEEVFIPYLHRLEYLHDIHVSVGAEVMFGEPIGTLGGNDYNTGNKYKYLQQVSYSIYMENKYFTGQRNSIITGKALEPQNFNRLINPEEFWDNKLEVGVSYSKDDNQKEV